MPEKLKTFKCLDHSAPTGEIKMQADMGPVVSALSDISAKMSSLKPVINVAAPGIPDIQVDAPVVHVQIPEMSMPKIVVNVPEIIPHITVAPAEVVINNRDGSPIITKVEFSTRTICGILVTIPIIMIAELVLKLFKIF